MKTNLCLCAYPNNNGGIWCHEHRVEVPEGACSSCEKRIDPNTVRHILQLMQVSLTKGGSHNA